MTTTEILTHGTVVHVNKTHRFGTDAMLLADFSRPLPGQRAVDLCSGCGIVALRWHDEGHRGICRAVEIEPEAHALLAETLAEDEAAASHITADLADLRSWKPEGRGSFQVVACNPPYFTGGYKSSDPQRAAARHENLCSIEDVASASAKLLQDGGKCCLCHRPEHLSRVLTALTNAGLEPKQLQFVRQSPEAKPWLFLVQAQKGRKPGLVLLPDLLPGQYPSY